MNGNGTGLKISEVNLMHLAISALLLIAYASITISGQDGTPLLYVLTGQLGGRIATIGARSINGNAGQ